LVFYEQSSHIQKTHILFYALKPLKLAVSDSGTNVAIIFRHGVKSTKRNKAMIGFNKFYNKKNDLRLEVFGASKAGHQQTTNEDAFLIGDIGGSSKLLAVADAFNRSGGEEASRLAVTELQDLLILQTAQDAKKRLGAAFEIISRDIDKHFREIQHLPPVGTTLSAVYVVGCIGFLAHVGNSRVYLVRGDEVRQLTQDDTFAQILKNCGVEPSDSSKKTLLQALGINCPLAPTLSRIELAQGDCLLLCTDGFSNNLSEVEIVTTLRENPSVDAAVEKLIETADERDGTDNITVVLARVYRATKGLADYTSRLKQAMPSWGLW
jgi:PPM family protein phosphatase